MAAQSARGSSAAGLGPAALSGLGFGLTSGILTTLGLMVGLNAGTNSRTAVAAGIATIAIADALSDAMGVRVSHEAGGAPPGAALLAAAVTFAAKMLFALSFLFPVLLLPLGAAIAVSVAWGMSLIFTFAWWVARRKRRRAWLSAVEHAALAALVVAAGQLAGTFVAALS